MATHHEIAVYFAEYLTSLLEFHHDDDSAIQFVDPIKTWKSGRDAGSILITLESGRQVLVRVSGLPAAEGVR